MEKVNNTPLVMGLYNPGMTPMLRAGLGGLAASLRAMALDVDPEQQWPCAVQLDGATAVVGEDSVTINWNGSDPVAGLKALFEASFKLDQRYGLVILPGAYDASTRARIEVVEALQRGLRATFLEHCSSVKPIGAGARCSSKLSKEDKVAFKKAKKASRIAARKLVTFEIGDQHFSLTLEGYSKFAHQGAYIDIAKALKTDSVVRLAGWAYPGATQRHIAFPETTQEYAVAEALCACFALVGCVVYPVTYGGRGSGVIVIPEPTNLIEFAALRPKLTPHALKDVFVTGGSDATLSVELALRMGDVVAHDQHLSHGSRSAAVEETHGWVLGKVAWDKQRQVRISTLSCQASEPDVDLYYQVTRLLPSTICVAKNKDKDASDDSTSYFVAGSVLRAFVTQNVASGRPWYTDFSTATDDGNNSDGKPHYVHYYWSSGNLGALRSEERKGLAQMVAYLDEASSLLVNSVHIAMRQRYGAIASETNGWAARQNRFENEHERWRIAFANSMTLDQIRAALASLWSRAGSNSVLKANWPKVLGLLTPTNWQAVRDLALVALASYESKESKVED
jgi:CRISPR-associated protein Cas8a1/Csx13